MGKQKVIRVGQVQFSYILHHGIRNCPVGLIVILGNFSTNMHQLLS